MTTESSISTGASVAPQLPQKAASASFCEPQVRHVITLARSSPSPPPDPLAADDSTRQALAAQRFGMASAGDEV